MPSKEFVIPLFNKVSRFYDLMNNALSLGIHWQWKKVAVKKALEFSPQKVLDGATGTGDLLHLFNKQNIPAVGVDISEGMLAQAKRKYPRYNFYHQDLTKMTFANKQFDVSTVAFGIRNVENIGAVLKELERVCAKGIVILEFGVPPNKFFRKLYFTIMNVYIPFMGKLFGRHEDYEYLISSSAKFASGPDFEKIVRDNVNVRNIETKLFLGGAVYLYKIELGSKE